MWAAELRSLRSHSQEVLFIGSRAVVWTTSKKPRHRKRPKQSLSLLFRVVCRSVLPYLDVSSYGSIPTFELNERDGRERPRKPPKGWWWKEVSLFDSAFLCQSTFSNLSRFRRTARDLTNEEMNDHYILNQRILYLWVIYVFVLLHSWKEKYRDECRIKYCLAPLMRDTP